MPKFTLIAEHDTGTSATHKVTHEFDVEYLPEALQNIDLFLRGVGYVFEGQLAIEEEPKYGLNTSFGEFNIDTDSLNNSEYYFDYDRNK